MSKFGKLRSLSFTLRLFGQRYNSFDAVESLTQKRRVLRPVIFTLGVGCGSLATCSIAQYERVRLGLESRYAQPSWFPTQEVEKAYSWRMKVHLWWQRLNEGKKIAAGIIFLNTAVFLCWQAPRCRSFLMKWFAANPGSGRSLPLLLSCFSHAEFWHLGANMVVLWSFAPLIHHLLGSEQFIGFYVTGGVASGLVSHMFKIITGGMSLSLGASGALLAVLAACCIERPEARLSILFLPFFTFSAKSALYGIIGFDLCGLLLRWKLFDHAGHLGGVMFGSWYVLYGHKWTWDQRGPLVSRWHELREKYSSTTG